MAIEVTYCEQFEIPDESVLAAAKRELFEESDTAEADISSVCVYGVSDRGAAL